MTPVNIHIAMHRGTWDITVTPEALQAVDNLPSGKVVTLERQIGDVQKQQVLVRPYYRRIINGELHIFAVQITPNKEASSGK